MDNQRRMARFSGHLTWIIGLAMLTLFFNQYLEKKNNPNAYLIAADKSSEVRLASDRRGHYQAPGYINGFPVQFLVDTGATYVSVSDELARRIGLEGQGRALVMTANGQAEVQRTELDSVTIGGIEMRSVPAMITPGMDGDSVLLGMSFLKHLEIRQVGSEMSLRIPQQ